MTTSTAKALLCYLVAVSVVETNGFQLSSLKNVVQGESHADHCRLLW